MQLSWACGIFIGVSSSSIRDEDPQPQSFHVDAEYGCIYTLEYQLIAFREQSLSNEDTQDQPWVWFRIFIEQPDILFSSDIEKFVCQYPEFLGYLLAFLAILFKTRTLNSRVVGCVLKNLTNTLVFNLALTWTQTFAKRLNDKKRLIYRFRKKRRMIYCFHTLKFLKAKHQYSHHMYAKSCLTMHSVISSIDSARYQRCSTEMPIRYCRQKGWSPTLFCIYSWKIRTSFAWSYRCPRNFHRFER